MPTTAERSNQVNRVPVMQRSVSEHKPRYDTNLDYTLNFIICQCFLYLYR
jgi:hypothetical protein